MDAEITIVFPTYNRREDVAYNLKDIRQNADVAYELFIIDNSDTPSEYDLQENEHYVYTGENLGAAARNIGLEKANCDIVLMLDDDSSFEKGSLSAILETFKNQPEAAGLNMPIKRIDGTLEAALLPTVFHGCGVAFRKSILAKYDIKYPLHFSFYGEEYLMTLQLYQAGYQMGFCDNAQVIHRRSITGRDKGRIFYLMARNNKQTWPEFVPDKYLKDVEESCHWRYKNIAIKENVLEDYQKGCDEKTEKHNHKKLSEKQFRKFAMLDKLEKYKGDKGCALVCSTGKFPSLVKKELQECGFSTIIFADFNTGLINQDCFGSTVLEPKEINNYPDATIILECTPETDKANWQKIITSNLINR